MLIVESSIFTKVISKLLSDEEYRELQNQLLEKPEHGVVIPGTSGLRKMRFSEGGKGKRGGGRLIYYWLANADTLYMVYAYKKSDAEDLTKAQMKVLVSHVSEFIHERKTL